MEPAKRPRILVVDDDPINVCILEEILAEQYELATAGNGEEALEKAPAFKPDLVLLDIMMPGIDGYEVCRRLKSNPRLRDAKVILVSAKAMLSERLEGYESGADDYLTKPFDDAELMAKVRVFLRLKSIEEIDRFKT
ncbi:MAG: response regulator, partial [Thermoanaerobaculia bacterium]